MATIRTNAAQRQRLCRQRRSRGQAVLRVVVDHASLTSAMVDAGILPETLIDNRNAVVEVLEQLVAEWAHSVTRDFLS